MVIKIDKNSIYLKKIYEIFEQHKTKLDQNHVDTILKAEKIDDYIEHVSTNKKKYNGENVFIKNYRNKLTKETYILDDKHDNYDVNIKEKFNELKTFLGMYESKLSNRGLFNVLPFQKTLTGRKYFKNLKKTLEELSSYDKL
ncbi:MAG: hypothetical protein ACLFPJ_04175 [Candidatus Woesearchaeota archaeon]